MSHGIHTFCFRQYRLTAYRQFVHWANRGQKMGRGVRVVLPSCIVQMIRKAFPEENPGDYKGFKEVIEVDELLEEDYWGQHQGYTLTARQWLINIVTIKKSQIKTYMPLTVCYIFFHISYRQFDPSHKSQNASVPYPTMHHFVTEMCKFLLQNGVLWDICLMHCGICEMGSLYIYMKKCHYDFLYMIQLHVYWKITHWGRVTHMWVCKLTIIGSDNGLLPSWCQASICISAGIL